jgi:hypothetical protein
MRSGRKVFSASLSEEENEINFRLKVLHFAARRKYEHNCKHSQSIDWMNRDCGEGDCRTMTNCRLTWQETFPRSDDSGSARRKENFDSIYCLLGGKVHGTRSEFSLCKSIINASGESVVVCRLGPLERENFLILRSIFTKNFFSFLFAGNKLRLTAGRCFRHHREGRRHHIVLAHPTRPFG